MDGTATSEPSATRPLCVLVVHGRYRVRGGEDGVYETECRNAFRKPLPSKSKA